MDIGHKLKKLREQHRYSQQEIADLLHISQRTYSNIESGKSKIYIEQLIIISQLFKFDLIEFLQEQGMITKKKSPKQSDTTNPDITNELIYQLKKRLQEKTEIIELLKVQIQLLNNK